MEIARGGFYEDTRIGHCPTRPICPLAAACGAQDDDVPSLYPTLCELGLGEELRADVRYEQRVFIVRSGVFGCLADPPDGDLKPVALYGPGDSFGLAELYASRELSATYHMRALSEATVCSLPARALRRVLEGHETTFAQRVTSNAFMNTSCAMYYHSRIMAKMKAEERLVMLLERFAELLHREGKRLDRVCLGQSDLALLAGADRMSVGRALHKLEDAGLVSLGYRMVQLLPPFFENRHPELVQLNGFQRLSASDKTNS